VRENVLESVQGSAVVGRALTSEPLVAMSATQTDQTQRQDGEVERGFIDLGGVNGLEPGNLDLVPILKLLGFFFSGKVVVKEVDEQLRETERVSLAFGSCGVVRFRSAARRQIVG
jgi:hypothetical protein